MENVSVDKFLDELKKLDIRRKKNISKESISENCINWVHNNISPDFTFRKYQLEAITDIISHVVNETNPTQVIEAPTGSGKSLISIISAGVLSDHYGMSSYILCSDLFLWSQYNDFINKFPEINKKFGVLKGQQGNYKCKVNLEDIKRADCKMSGYPWRTMLDSEKAVSKGYNCALTCPYVLERKKAMNSSVTLMTYALYHRVINYRAVTGFGRRDVVFCDECHNIPDIIASAFRPEMIGEQKKFLDIFREFARKQKKVRESDLIDPYAYDSPEPGEMSKRVACFNYVRNTTDTQFENEFYSIYEELQEKKTSLERDLELIKDYKSMLSKFSSTATLIKNYLAKRKIKRNKFSVADKNLYDASQFYSGLYGDWEIFLEAVEDAGIEYVVKTITEKRDPDKTVVDFRCVKEDYLCWYFLLNTADNCVMLSATVGGIEAFSQNIGVEFTKLKYAEFNRIPSIFDYSKSPIIFLNWWKMSHTHKVESFPNIQLLTYQVCEDKHPDSKGIIQTGSYANAIELYQNAPSPLQSRMLLYSNPKEKEAAIEEHRNSTEPTILVGPTLTEGIDLPGDLCRFVVILKVPFPVITDAYVRRKIQLFPLWYKSTTSNVIIQGIGRGNRFETDYCSTYILDASFYDLYKNTKSQYAPEIQNRIIIFNR